MSYVRFETDFPLCRNPSCHNRHHACAKIKDWYREGYLRIGGGLAAVSALAEPRCTVEGEYTAPEYDGARMCGSGEGCSKRARKDGWLCAEHSKMVNAIMDSGPNPSERLKRGRLSFHRGAAECVAPGCSRFAQTGNIRCGRHSTKVAA